MKLFFGLLLGIALMSFTEVARSDTFEVQRQKINDLGNSVGTLIENAKTPLYVQTIKEDFNYYDGYLSDNAQPSPHFKFESNTTGVDSVSICTMSYGVLGMEQTIESASGTAFSRIYGTYTATPWYTPATDKQIIESKLSAVTGSIYPNTELRIGFSELTSATSLRLSKTSAFFEITKPAGNHLGSTRELRAVVVNSQSPTPAVVHDIVIASPFTYTSTPVLRVEVSGTDVKFYNDGVLVSTFVTNLFGTGAASAFAYWFKPVVEFKSFDSGGAFYGETRAAVDYVYVQSEITR